MDMSMDDFQPLRVDSKAFRGFSINQDNLILPERNEIEDRSYWDSIQEGREFVSD